MLVGRGAAADFLQLGRGATADRLPAYNAVAAEPRGTVKLAKHTAISAAAITAMTRKVVGHARRVR